MSEEQESQDIRLRAFVKWHRRVKRDSLVYRRHFGRMVCGRRGPDMRAAVLLDWLCTLEEDGKCDAEFDGFRWLHTPYEGFWWLDMTARQARNSLTRLGGLLFIARAKRIAKNGDGDSKSMTWYARVCWPLVLWESERAARLYQADPKRRFVDSAAPGEPHTYLTPEIRDQLTKWAVGQDQNRLFFVPAAAQIGDCQPAVPADQPAVPADQPAVPADQPAVPAASLTYIESVSESCRNSLVPPGPAQAQTQRGAVGDDDESLIAILIEEGISQKQARQFVRFHDEANILQQLRSWREVWKPGGKKAGWLADAIRNRWPVPLALEKRQISQDEAERRQRARDEKREREAGEREDVNRRRNEIFAELLPILEAMAPDELAKLDKEVRQNHYLAGLLDHPERWAGIDGITQRTHLTEGRLAVIARSKGIELPKEVE